MIDKKRFIRTGYLWGLQVGRQEMPRPKNLVGYSFVIKGKVWKERTSLCFLSRHHAPIISSSFRLGRGVFLSLHGQARPTNYWGFFVCRDLVLGIINWLSALVRVWVSCHHCLILWGHVPHFCCMVLLLSKPCLVFWLSSLASLSNH